MRFFCLVVIAILTCPLSGMAQGQAVPRTIHVFVALADNLHQGIVPVPAAIGRGDDPEHNLYWGCDEGLRGVFGSAGPQWKRALQVNNPTSEILVRLVYRNADANAWLVADAYRGDQIKRATTDFLGAAAGHLNTKLIMDNRGRKQELAIGGGASLVAYIGHNGLMDFKLDELPRRRGAPSSQGKPAIVLCCKSQDYFTEPLRAAGARPLLLTTQLMYPGSFILKAAVEGWLRGENAEAIADRAAQAYSRNQKISVKSARGVFASGADQ